MCNRCGGKITKRFGFDYCESCNSFNVLDKGFVKLVEFAGGDNMVVRAARISYGKELKGEEQDRKLINYMMKHRHGTPFEHSFFSFHVKSPIFVARQWFRHRIGSFNEISGRYVEYKDEFFIPESLRAPHPKNKQGSIEANLQNEKELLEEYRRVIEECYNAYRMMIESGVAREIARAILPLALYTEFYWSVNPRSLMNFLSLRLGEDAQKEIREYATRIAIFFKEKMPWTFSAFAETENNPILKMIDNEDKRK